MNFLFITILATAMPDSAIKYQVDFPHADTRWNDLIFSEIKKGPGSWTFQHRENKADFLRNITGWRRKVRKVPHGKITARLRFRHLSKWVMQWGESESKDGPPVQFAVNGNRAAMKLHDRINDGKHQTRPHR